MKVGWTTEKSIQGDASQRAGNTPTSMSPFPLKVAEHQLKEKVSLSRNLWAALVGAISLADDWCAGPLLAWRYYGRSLVGC